MAKQRLYKAFSALWLSSLLSAMFAFLLQIVLARSFSVEDYGAFASAFTLVSLLIPLVGFGIAQYWLKVFGQSGYGAFSSVRPGEQVVKLNASIVAICLLAWAFFGPHTPLMAIALCLLFFYLLGQVGVELLMVRFQLEGNYLLLSVWQVLPSLVRLIFGLLIVFLLGELASITHLLVMFAAIGVSTFILSMVFLRPFYLGVIKLDGHEKHQGDSNNAFLDRIETTYKQAWPFALATLFYLIYFQSDIILLQYLVGEWSAGIYNVAFIIMAAVLLFPGVLYQKLLLPKMHRWAYHDSKRFNDAFKVGNLLMLVLGVLAMFFAWWLVPWLVPIAFGSDYADSIDVFLMLAFTIPVLFVASSYGSILVTQENIRTKVLLMGVVALLNIVLNSLWIPEYGMVGAALSTLLSNAVLLLLYMMASKTVMKSNEV